MSEEGKTCIELMAMLKKSIEAAELSDEHREYMERYAGQMESLIANAIAIENKLSNGVKQ